MPALLFLFRGRRTGPVPRAGADMAALPPADLLQWAQLAGGPTEQVGHRLSNDRQRLHTYSRLAAGTAALQRLGTKSSSRAAERSTPAVLPNLKGLRQRISLERGPVRIRHRHRLP